MSKAEEDQGEASESFNTKDRGEVAGGGPEHGGSSSSSRDLTLYLFGRTGREKEEWFQRFLSASKPKTDLKVSSFAWTKSGEQTCLFFGGGCIYLCTTQMPFFILNLTCLKTNKPKKSPKF